jgi:hypothetical protein
VAATPAIRLADEPGTAVELGRNREEEPAAFKGVEVVDPRVE